jgi:hypothetical protein
MLQAVRESSEVIMQTALGYCVFFENMHTKYDLPVPNRTIYVGVFNPTNCVLP